jgi:hypothetical protein
MHLSPRQFGLVGRGALLWAAAVFVCGQLALSMTMSLWRPELRDPEYGLKLRSLRARLAEHARRQPSVLVMGSSRVAVGFRPASLPVYREGTGSSPVIFNFSLCYSGPLLELICLRRLLDDGIRPEHIILEIWPPLLNLESVEENQDTSLNILRMGWQDVRVLDRYSAPSWTRYRRWGRAQMVPWSFYRYPIMNRHAPDWLDPSSRRDVNWHGLDDWGWLQVPDYRVHLSDAAYRAILERTRGMSGGVLANLQITDPARRALRELLTLCRERHVAVTLLLMPEAVELRSWYSTESLARLDGFFRGLGQEFGVPVVDARAWAANDHFADGVHLVHDGADGFTQRLWREVIQPLLESPSPVAIRK